MSVPSPAVRSRQLSFERERGVYQVLQQADLAHTVVTVSEPSRPEDFLRVLKAIAARSIPIFLIKLHRGAISFALESSQVPQLEACLAELGSEFRIRHDLVLLTILASSMRDLTGVMVQIADALSQVSARLYGVGDSHNSVQCLIDGAHAGPAITHLSDVFDLEDAGA